MRNNDYDTKVEKKPLLVEIVLFNCILIKLLENPTKWYLAYLTLQTVGSKASWQAENLPITSTTERNSLYSHMLKKKSPKSYRIITPEGLSEPQICIINQLSYGRLIQHSKTAKCSIYSGILYCPPSPCTGNSSCSDELWLAVLSCLNVKMHNYIQLIIVNT